MLSANKTFILGVGAQKAGTTWLHAQLCKNSFFNPGFTKEYHTFDCIYTDQYSEWPEKWVEKIKRIDNTTERNRRIKADLARRLLFVYDPKTYYAYFDHLIGSTANTSLVADITPSYSLLNENALAEIKHNLEKKGFNVKVVFLMRDPVERIWSAKRMRRRHELAKGVQKSRDIEDSLLRIAGSQSKSLKTRYEYTINNLDNVFAPEDLFFGFYEDLFNQSTFGRLKAFINHDLKNPDFNESYNVSPKSTDLSPETSLALANHFRETYTYVNQRFNGAANQFWNKNFLLSQKEVP